MLWISNQPTAPFRHAAHWVGRAIDPFVRLRDAFHIGAAYEAFEADMDDDVIDGTLVPDDELTRSM